MTTKKSIQTRIGTPVLLAIYLIAMLLPVNIATAESWLDSCGGTTLQAAHATASAEEQVTVPAELVNQMAYAANWKFSYTDSEKIFELIYGRLSDELYIKYLFPAEKHREVLNQFETRYREKVLSFYGTTAGLTSDEILNTALRVALDVPEMKSLVPYVAKGLLPRSHTPSDPLHQSVARSSLTYATDMYLNEKLDESLKKQYNCAKSNPSYKHTIDGRHGARTKSKIGESAKQITAQNPDNPVLKELEKLVAENGSMQLSINDLTKMSKDEFAKINDAIDGMQDALVEIDKQQKDILDYLDRAEARDMVRAIKEANAAHYAATIKGLQSATFILSTLGDFLKPGMGTQISTTLNSAITVADSIKKWMDAIDTMQGLDKILNLSTVAMTGNMLGAAMNIISMFGPQQPTPEQMILEEIGKLREQVNELRTEMHDRFDRIDKSLNTIYTTMQDRFDLIDIQLGKINGNIVEVQKALVELDAKLSRMERNNFELINAVARRELVESVNLGLGYRQRNGQPMPYSPDFDTFANKLYTWITYNAYDAGSVGPSQRDYSDGALLDELSTYPLDTNLSYLNGWIKSRGLLPLSDKPLPSPRDWLFATRAFSQLALEEPEHIKTLMARDPQRVTQMQNAARDVENAALNISTLNTVSGTIGNTLLYSTVITYYQGKLNGLDKAIENQEAKFMQEIMGKEGIDGKWVGKKGKWGAIDRTEPFTLHAGIDQVLAYQSPGLQGMVQGSSDEKIALPANLLPQIADINRYVLAEYLRISNTATIEVYMNTTLENPRIERGCIPEPDACPVMGDLIIEGGVRFSGINILSNELMAGSVLLSVVKGDLESPDDYAVRHWGNLKARFEREATVVQPTPELAGQRKALFDDMTRQMETRIELYQQALYRQIADAITTSSLRVKARELAGSKLLLESFVSLGLPRAVESNDVLRAMLYGEQQLLGDVQIAQQYAISGSQPITGAALMSNPRIVINQLADKRTTAVNAMIGSYLNAITAKTHRESLDYLSSTRRELDLMVLMAQVEEKQPNPNPVPADPKRIFLPLVNR